MKTIQVKVHMDFEVSRLEAVFAAVVNKLLLGQGMTKALESLIVDGYTAQEVEAALSVSRDYPTLLRPRR